MKTVMLVSLLAAAGAFYAAPPVAQSAGLKQVSEFAAFSPIDGPKGDWAVLWDEDGNFCYMHRDFKPIGNTRASIEVRYHSVNPVFASLLITNSALTARQGDAPVEVWFDRQGDKPADGRGTAHVQSGEDGPYFAIDIQKSIIARIASSNTLTVRLAGGPLVTYSTAPAHQAVVDLFDCDWAMK